LIKRFESEFIGRLPVFTVRHLEVETFTTSFATQKPHHQQKKRISRPTGSTYIETRPCARIAENAFLEKTGARGL